MEGARFECKAAPGDASSEVDRRHAVGCVLLLEVPMKRGVENPARTPAVRGYGNERSIGSAGEQSTMRGLVSSSLSGRLGDGGSKGKGAPNCSRTVILGDGPPGQLCGCDGGPYGIRGVNSSVDPGGIQAHLTWMSWANAGSDRYGGRAAWCGRAQISGLKLKPIARTRIHRGPARGDGRGAGDDHPRFGGAAGGQRVAVVPSGRSQPTQGERAQ